MVHTVAVVLEHRVLREVLEEGNADALHLTEGVVMIRPGLGRVEPFERLAAVIVDFPSLSRLCEAQRRDVGGFDVVLVAICAVAD